MSDGEQPSDAIKQQITASLPPVTRVCTGLLDRSGIDAWLPEEVEHVSLTALCFRDLGDLIWVAGRALYLARSAWDRADAEKLKPTLVFSPESRFYLDYCALALAAASNHLASAMWHLHEQIDTPLGSKYKSARGVIGEWKKRKEEAPSSLGILIQLLQDPAWVIIHEYRDAWIHRGIPVIEGEYRKARREIWQDESDPPPGPYFMKHEAAGGRVAYMVQRDHSERRLPEFLEKATEALRALITATEEFLPTFDAICGKYNITFDDKTKPSPARERE